MTRLGRNRRGVRLSKYMRGEARTAGHRKMGARGCLSWAELNELAEGAAASEEQLRHLEECRRCARALAELRALLAGARAVPEPEAPLGAEAVRQAVQRAGRVGQLSCARVQGLLEAYLEGELRPRLAAAVEVHLAGCDECQAEYDAALQARRAVEVAREAEVVVPAGLGERVRRAVAEAAFAAGRRRRWPQVASLAAAAAAAAALLLAVLIWPPGNQRPVEPSGQPSASVVAQQGERSPQRVAEAPEGAKTALQRKRTAGAEQSRANQRRIAKVATSRRRRPAVSQRQPVSEERIVELPPEPVAPGERSGRPLVSAEAPTSADAGRQAEAAAPSEARPEQAIARPEAQRRPSEAAGREAGPAQRQREQPRSQAAPGAKPQPEGSSRQQEAPAQPGPQAPQPKPERRPAQPSGPMVARAPEESKPAQQPRAETEPAEQPAREERLADAEPRWLPTVGTEVEVVRGSGPDLEEIARDLNAQLARDARMERQGVIVIR